MICNKNSLRTPPSLGEKNIYHDIEEKEVQVRSEVMDADGNPSGIINMSSITKFVPKDSTRDTSLRSSDFDLQCLIDAGIEPSEVGNSANFFMHKDSNSVIVDIVDELSKHKGKFYDEVKETNNVSVTSPEVVNNITDTTNNPKE